jgi:biotin carboxyl carrier protein
MRKYAVTLGTAEAVEVEVQELPAEAGDAAGTRRVRVVAGGVEKVLDLRAAGPVRYTWIDGVRVVNSEVEPKGDKLTVTVRGDGFAATVADARAVKIPAVGRGNRAAGPLVMRAPMPGRVVKLLAKVGDEVKAGRGLLVVEAMKMENELRAPRDGRVQEIRVSEGTAVESGQDLFVLE